MTIVDKNLNRVDQNTISNIDRTDVDDAEQEVQEIQSIQKNFKGFIDVDPEFESSDPLQQAIHTISKVVDARDVGKKEAWPNT